LFGYRTTMQSLWLKEGLKVDYSYYSVTKGLIEAHMGDPDLYRYAYLGHGWAGQLTDLDDPDGDGVVRDGKHTVFGIAEMRLIACDTFFSEDNWKWNVSRAGTLITVEGELKSWPWPDNKFHYTNGK